MTATAKTHWCPNPWEWLDLTIRWVSYDRLGMAICSLCWATKEAYLYYGGDPDLRDGVPLEALPTFDFAAYWNSPRLQEIRRQWLDGELPAMCVGCPRLPEGEVVLPRYNITDQHHRRILSERLTAVPGPRIINIGYDPSCNLACPSCRGRYVRFKTGEYHHTLLKAFQDNVVRKILATARWAFFSGYGDPFGSLLYWELLQTLQPDECPELELVFLTNGLGFTFDNYGRIPMRERIKVVQFSMDAATSETYRKLRGGSWERLLQNCAFVADLRKRGKIDRSEWGFVFQAANWRELPAFLEIARAYSVDKVVVYTILNHNHAGKFGEVAIHHPDHPEHTEAMRVLDAARNAVGLDVYVELAKASSETA
jgi:hypothetical protein